MTTRSAAYNYLLHRTGVGAKALRRSWPQSGGDRDEAWRLLPLVFAGALVFGWLRIKSGSIIGPW